MDKGARREDKISFRYRCYAVKRKDYWYGHCIDLNLSAEAEDFKELQKRIDELVAGYIETVCDTADEKSIGELLSRKSGIKHRLIYGLIYLVKLSRQRRSSEREGKINNRWAIFSPERLIIPAC